MGILRLGGYFGWCNLELCGNIIDCLAKKTQNKKN